MLYRWAHRLRLIYFFFRRPKVHGVRAIALTPDNQVILLRHTYGSSAWMLPGGGVVPGLSGEGSVLQELREEVGMSAHGAATHVGDFKGKLGHADDYISVFVVRDVVFEAPKKHALVREIEVVRTFPLHALPHDMSPATRRRLAELQGQTPKSDKW